MSKGYLYKITHTPTGLMYFGSRKTPEGISVSADSYMGSPVGSNKMRELFDTCDESEFTKEVLTVGLYEDIVEAEVLLIKEAWEKFGKESEGGLVTNLAVGMAIIQTDEIKASKSASAKGRPKSAETRAKMSAAKKGNLVGSKNPNYGKGQHGGKHKRPVIRVDTGEVWESGASAARSEGVVQDAICRRISNRSFGGIWRYLDEYNKEAA